MRSIPNLKAYIIDVKLKIVSREHKQWSTIIYGVQFSQHFKNFLYIKVIVV